VYADFRLHKAGTGLFAYNSSLGNLLCGMYIFFINTLIPLVQLTPNAAPAGSFVYLQGVIETTFGMMFFFK
jgi:hypothetical protein